MDPSVYVRLHGGVPVRSIETTAEAPLHIVVVPLIVAVGRGLTVMVADPERSAGIEVQRLSCKDAIEYVVLVAGVTMTEIGLVLPLKGVPSESVPFHGPVPVRAIDRVAD